MKVQFEPLLTSVTVYANCDACQKPSKELTEVDQVRRLVGTDENVPVRICKTCMAEFDANGELTISNRAIIP